MALANSDLSVTLYFDLDNNRFRIQDNTNYTGATPAIAEANIRGVYTLTDPNSNVLHQNADYDNPDVATSIDADLYSAYKSFTVAAGAYTLVYNVKDVNTSTTYTKTFTFTYATSYIPTVVIGIESNVGLATIESTDETSYDATITLNTRTHTLTYPSTWGSTTETSTTIDSISLTELYTGQYSATITSAITRTGTDNLIISKSITGTQTHDVWDTDGMYAVRAALNTFYDRWQANQTAEPKEGRRERDLWIEINANYALYNSYKQNGDIDNAGEYLDNIKTILSAESIDTTIDPSVSVPVTSVIPGYATRWLQGAGAPSASTGRNEDYYINTSTNQYYLKASGSWGSPIGTLGSNTLIEFSDTGGSSSVSWSATYANGENYIRFSGDGGTTYTSSAKFIDGYVYYAYASDASGTDFICNDDPTFTFNPVLEYIAIKKFQVSHSGDLVAGDFTGLFTKYRDNGIIAYCTTPSVSIPTDASGNNAVYPSGSDRPTVYIYDGDTDVTTSWTVSVSATSNVTASIVSSNIVNLSALTDNTASVTIACTRSGYDTLNLIILVYKAKAGQAIVDGTSVDDVTIGLNGSSKLYVKDAGVTGVKLNSNVVDDSTIEISGNTLQIKDSGVTTSKITNSSVTSEKIDKSNCFFIQYGTELAVTSATGTGMCGLTDWTVALYDNTTTTLTTYSLINEVWTKVGNSLDISGDFPASTTISTVGMTALTSSTIALLHDQTNAAVTDAYLMTYSWDGTDWSKVGNSLDVLSGNGLVSPSLTTLTSSTIAVTADFAGTDNIRTYSWDGTDWSQVGNSFALPSTPAVANIYALSSTSIVYYDIRNRIQKYNWDGTDWTTDGNAYTLSAGSGYSAVVSLSATEIVGFGTFDDYMYDYSFDGTDWSLVGNKRYFNAGNSIPKMDILSNKLIVIFSDSGDDEITSFIRIKAL